VPDQPKRVRRRPEVAEREVLDAAESLLRERNFRDLSVEELMERTGLKRSSFYVYFHDRSDVVVRLLARAEGDLLAVAQPWLTGAADSREDLLDGLGAVASVWVEHGHVILAAREAAHHGDHAERAWQGFLDRWTEVLARRLSIQTRDGMVDVAHSALVAEALVRMNEQMLLRVVDRKPVASPGEVVDALQVIWERVLYPA
jgi:TetR/AcrR family transcriptional regulator, ethionamide resistance regulator